MYDIEGGGIISCAAGGLAFGLIGAMVSLPVAAITGNGAIVAKTAIFAGAIGVI